MKKTTLLLSAGLIFSSGVLFAQGNPNKPAKTWSTTGNSNTDAQHFIGTTDQEDFVIKTDNIERIRITSNGKIFLNGIRYPEFDGTLGQALTTDGTGNLVFKTINTEDSDADPLNEIQDLQLTGNTLTITNNGQASSIDLTQYLELPLNALVGEILKWDGNSWTASQLPGSNWVSNGDDVTLVNGVVGIGTDTPNAAYKLNVEGDAVINNGKLRITGTNNFGGPQIVLGGTLANNGDWGIEYNSSRAGLNFWKPWPSTNNGNAKFFLADNGRVGVGTDSPLAKFDVNGNVRIADGTQGLNKVLTSDATGKASWKDLSSITPPVSNVVPSLNATDYLKVGTGSLFITAPGGLINASTTAHEIYTTGQDLLIQSNASSGSANTILNLNKNSNVGVGLLNPMAKLDVQIADDFTYTKESGLRITYPIPLLIPGGVGFPAPTQINQSIFEVRQDSPGLSGLFSSKFIVKSNGRVGIGESNPEAKLHVNGDTYVNNGKIRVMGNNSFGGPQIVFGGDPTNNGNWGIEYVSGTVNGLNFWTPGSNFANYRMFLSDNGAVSIGLDPSEMFDPISGDALPYKLFVEQGILTEKLKVALRNTSDWADYVFEEGYDLKSIEEVEEFITNEGHLPGVPSAEELKETGIDMATMDAKLLEKIEELTLYIIELKKEVEALKK